MNAFAINSGHVPVVSGLSPGLMEAYPALGDLGFAADEVASAGAAARLDQTPHGACLTFIEGARRLRLTSALNPETEDLALVEKAALDPTEGVICFGLGLGYYLEELNRRLTAEAPIWALESRPELAALALQRPALAKLLERPGFRLFIGPFAGPPWPENEPLPPQQLWRPATARNFADEYPLKAAPDRHPPLRPRALKKLLLFQGGYFLDREIKNAAAELGLETSCWNFHRGEEGDGREFKDLLRIIKANRPEMVLTVNHLGFDSEGILDDVLTRLNLPAASWFVDSPVFILGGHRPRCQVKAFSWDRDYLPWFKEQGFDGAHYLPLASDPAFFKPSGRPRPFARRLSFVGDSLSAATEKFLKKIGYTGPAAIPPDFMERVDAAARSFLPLASVRPDRLEVKGLADDFGLAPKVLNDLAALITWRASRIKRLNILSALPTEKLIVAGDPGWPGLLPLPPSNFRPPIDYYAGLADFYQESQINLNITSAQMKTGLNQRVFDVPASGAFLLTDAQKQLAELFEPGREAAVYQNPEEAAELAAWYAARDEARSAVASAGLGRVRRQHLYRHRLAEMLRLMVK